MLKTKKKLCKTNAYLPKFNDIQNTMVTADKEPNVLYGAPF